MTDSIKNPSPIAPASTAPSKAAAKVRNASAEGTGKATLVKKKGAQAGDPYAQPKPARTNKLYERGGAKYGVTAKIPAYAAVEAGFTQGNGRIIASAINRSRPNFQAAADDSMA